MSQIPMPVQPGADIVASYPLIAQLFSRHRYAQLEAGEVDAFVAQPGHALLVFLEDPMRIKETLDLVVIVPELALALSRALPGRCAVAGSGAAGPGALWIPSLAGARHDEGRRATSARSTACATGTRTSNS